MKPCKIWNGYKTKEGYGLVCRSTNGVKKTWTIHRYAWVQANGPIPDGVDVCHSCDIRSCYELSHLFLGTRKVNMEDCKSKGRNAKQLRHGSAKISVEMAERIKARYAGGGVSQRAVAAEFGVVQGQVYQVLSGNHWTQKVRGKKKRKVMVKK
jgi:hypothetical protein